MNFLYFLGYELDENGIVCYLIREVKNLRDLPFFTTESGAASLTLSQIPYTEKAYIRIQDSLTPEELLKECVDFCTAAGARHIYATGHPVCEKYPEHTRIIQMRAELADLGDTDAALFPVTEKTLEDWRQTYNQKIKNVPNGAWMTLRDAEDMLKQGSGYFVHRNGELLGIGKVFDTEIQWVASVQNGAGVDVVRALCHAVSGDFASVTVASTNKKAVRLYEKLGFIPTKEISVWYTVK